MKTDVPLQMHYGGLALVILGPIMVLLGGTSFLAARSAQSWPTVKARVVQSKIEVSKKVSGLRRSRTTSSDYFTAAVKYEYVVDGKQYTGDRIHRSCNPSGFDRSVAAQWTRKCPPGAEITVHYAPGNPSLAVIDPTADTLGLSLILGSGLIMIPVGLLLRRMARQLQPPVPTQAVVPSRPPVPSQPAVTSPRAVPRQTAFPKPAAPAATALPRQAEIAAPEPRQTHFLLRTMAVMGGLVFFFLGAVVFPDSVGRCVQAINAPRADAAETVARFITMAIMGSFTLLGAYLICRGTKRTNARTSCPVKV